MKKSEIQVGGCYVAQVNGRPITVRITEIGTRSANKLRKGGTFYHGFNVATGRKITFKSVRKFRCRRTT